MVDRLAVYPAAVQLQRNHVWGASSSLWKSEQRLPLDDTLHQQRMAAPLSHLRHCHLALPLPLPPPVPPAGHLPESDTSLPVLARFHPLLLAFP